jgi:hypothetical protein
MSHADLVAFVDAAEEAKFAFLSRATASAKV